MFNSVRKHAQDAGHIILTKKTRIKNFLSWSKGKLIENRRKQVAFESSDRFIGKLLFSRSKRRKCAYLVF